MNPIFIYPLLIVLLFSCQNNKKKELPAVDKQQTDPLEKTISLAKNGYDTLATLAYPLIIVYYNRDERDYFLQVNKNGKYTDTAFFYEAGIQIDSVILDTVRFGNGKYPEVIIKWFASGTHSYGGNGGWNRYVDNYEIWNIDSMKSIFSTYLSEKNIEYVEDRNGMEQGDIVDEATTKSSALTKLFLNLNKKQITVNSTRHNNNSIETKQVTYRYKNGTFVADKDLNHK
jgi:hypothetical protein